MLANVTVAATFEPDRGDEATPRSGCRASRQRTYRRGPSWTVARLAGWPFVIARARNWRLLMFEQILGIDILTALLLPVAWGLAGYLAGRLAFCRTRGRLLVRARITLTILGLALLLVAAKLVTIQQFWSYGWLFARDRVIVSLPLIVGRRPRTLVWSFPAIVENRARDGHGAAGEGGCDTKSSGVRPSPRGPHPVNGARRNPRRVRHAISFGPGRAAPEPRSRGDLHRRHGRVVGSPAAPLLSMSQPEASLGGGLRDASRADLCLRARARRGDHGLVRVLHADERAAGPLQHDVSRERRLRRRSRDRTRHRSRHRS